MLKSTKKYIDKEIEKLSEKIEALHHHFHEEFAGRNQYVNKELAKLKNEPQINLIRQPLNTGKIFELISDLTKEIDDDERKEKENYERIKNLIESSVYGKLELSSEYGEIFPRVAQFPSWFEIKKGLDKMQAETKNRFEEFAKEHDDCNCIDCQLKELSKIENKSMYELTTYCNLLTRKMMLSQSEKGGLEVEIKDLKRINSAQENKTKLKQVRIEQLEKIQEMDKNKIKELNDSILIQESTIDTLSSELESKDVQVLNLQEIIDNGKAENKRLIKRCERLEKRLKEGEKVSHELHKVRADYSLLKAQTAENAYIQRLNEVETKNKELCEIINKDPESLQARFYKLQADYRRIDAENGQLLLDCIVKTG